MWDNSAAYYPLKEYEQERKPLRWRTDDAESGQRWLFGRWQRWGWPSSGIKNGLCNRGGDQVDTPMIRASFGFNPSNSLMVTPTRIVNDYTCLVVNHVFWTLLTRSACPCGSSSTSNWGWSLCQRRIGQSCCDWLPSAWWFCMWFYLSNTLWFFSFLRDRPCPYKKEGLTHRLQTQLYLVQ